MCLISIIVPCYNVEDHVSRAIKSILDQTYTKTEILLINDGSTDKTLEIIEKFQNQDTRIRVFNQENQGLSSARNVGLDNAKGDFLYFMDSDDLIDKNLLSILYHYSIGKENIICSCGFKYLDDKSNDSYTDKYFGGAKFYTMEDVFSDLSHEKGKIRFEVWNKLFPVNLISNIRFKIGQVYEDVYFMRMVLQGAKGVFQIEDPLYVYTINRQGSTNSSFNHRRIDILDELQEFVTMFEAAKKHTLKKKYEALIFNTGLSLLFDCKRLKVNITFRDTIVNKLKRNSSIITNPYVHKMKSLAFFLSPGFCILLIDVSLRLKNVVRIIKKSTI